MIILRPANISNLGLLNTVKTTLHYSTPGFSHCQGKKNIKLYNLLRAANNHTLLWFLIVSCQETPYGLLHIASNAAETGVGD